MTWSSFCLPWGKLGLWGWVKERSVLREVSLKWQCYLVSLKEPCWTPCGSNLLILLPTTSGAKQVSLVPYMYPWTHIFTQTSGSPVSALSPILITSNVVKNGSFLWEKCADVSFPDLTYESDFSAFPWLGAARLQCLHVSLSPHLPSGISQMQWTTGCGYHGRNNLQQSRSESIVGVETESKDIVDCFVLF